MAHLTIRSTWIDTGTLKVPRAAGQVKVEKWRESPLLIFLSAPGRLGLCPHADDDAKEALSEELLVGDRSMDEDGWRSSIAQRKSVRRFNASLPDHLFEEIDKGSGFGQP